MRKIWEYVSDEVIDTEIPQLLNKRGADGWQVVHMRQFADLATIPATFNHYYILFIREYIEPEKCKHVLSIKTPAICVKCAMPVEQWDIAL